MHYLEENDSTAGLMTFAFVACDRVHTRSDTVTKPGRVVERWCGRRGFTWLTKHAPLCDVVLFGVLWCDGVRSLGHVTGGCSMMQIVATKIVEPGSLLFRHQRFLRRNSLQQLQLSHMGSHWKLIGSSFFMFLPLLPNCLSCVFRYNILNLKGKINRDDDLFFINAWQALSRMKT